LGTVRPTTSPGNAQIAELTSYGFCFRLVSHPEIIHMEGFGNRFNGQRLREWEARRGAEVKLSALPAGTDDVDPSGKFRIIAHTFNYPASCRV